MSEKLRTLIITSNGFGWRATLLDTVIKGLFGINASYSNFPPYLKNELTRKIFQERYTTLSYVYDWLDAFQNNANLEISVINLANLRDLFQHRQAIRESPLIIILHSALGDSMAVIGRIASLFQERRGKLVSFVGNEYLEMPEKIGFLQAVETDFICSQLPLSSAKRFYAACTRSKILTMPHALNQRLYRPGPQARKIDIGFRGTNYPLFIGDNERNNFVHYVERNLGPIGLRGDFSYKNVERKEWAFFLQSCKGTVGAESGSYYLNDQGQDIIAAWKYLIKNPNTNLAELSRLFFQGTTDYFSGKCISSRHFEAIGTQTCQILLEGDYNGLLTPDVHYIPVKKDLSDVGEAIQKFKDDAYRTQIAATAHDYALNGQTYDGRVKSLLECVGLS